MTRVRSTMILASALILIATACGRQSPRAAEASASPSPSRTAQPTPVSTWLVILRVAPDPAGVRDEATALAAVLGGAIQVGPGSCFTGIPARFGGDRYILGATGASRAEVDGYAIDAQIEPLFEGLVQQVCVD